jgi:hypothetical protein
MNAIDRVFPSDDAPATQTPAATEAPVPQPPVSQDEEPTTEARPGYVPLAGLLSERDKRKAAEETARQHEAQLTAVRRELDELKAPRPQQQFLPDPLVDPEGYANALRQEQVRIALNATLNTSETIARQQHGPKVDEALAWLQTRAGSPEHQRLLADNHPYQAMIDAYERDKALQELGDPRTARERLEAEIRAKIMAEMQQSPQAAAGASAPQFPRTAPASLNTVAGNGPSQPRLKSPFESVFRE